MKKILSNFKDALALYMKNEDALTSLLQSLIYRHFNLSEEHAQIQDDSEWDNFEEWEYLENLFESMELTYTIDSDDKIYFTTGE